MSSLARATALLGALTLLHSVYAVARYRDVLKLTQQEFAGLPFHLAAEVCVGAALALFGGYGLAGTLKPIIVTRGLSMDAGSYRADFAVFSHRGRALPHNLPSSL